MLVLPKVGQDMVNQSPAASIMQLLLKVEQEEINLLQALDFKMKVA